MYTIVLTGTDTVTVTVGIARDVEGKSAGHISIVRSTPKIAVAGTLGYARIGSDIGTAMA